MIRIIEIIQREGYLSNVIFISFDFENMLTIRRLLPKQRAQYLTVKYSEELVEQLVNERLDLDILHEVLTKENIEYMHSRGIVINCWTVDDPARGEELASWGVDFITSNILEAGSAR